MGKVVGVTFFPYLKILLQFAITMCAITTMFSNDFSDEKETVVVLELPHITEKKWWCYFYVNLRLILISFPIYNKWERKILASLRAYRASPNSL